ncbi:VanW family protein [Clostridium celatum]|uniref:G5 domain protein n=1 Tax=Clostridium celatum DSM 1785 TaxID=545697 RepID=L1QKD1_9CLOT|nr:VanW family protein [Clostridium celatum]EKY28165.1 G5 domain protein [Clostridium celatum DSM 1785]MCE9654078.1 VanW family protein [Clostridium celatum]MDU2266237.1 VanW family protein [Clostridium celatum]MDU6296500.1 VanW family protein [Clostridium celatum]
MEKDNNINKKSVAFYKNKKNILIASGVLVLALGVTFGYVMNVKGKVDSWEDKIYPGVQAYGLDLGGKTKEEAVNILNNELVTLIGNKTITVSVGDRNFEIKYSDLNPTVNAEETVVNALEYGKEEGMFSKKSMIEDGVEYQVEPVLSYNEEKLKEFENDIESQVDIAAVNASITINSGQISITPEQNGKKIDSEELHNKLIECINPNPTSNESVAVELKEYAPRITSAELAKIDGRISQYIDTYRNDGSGRVTNMELATGFVNGTLLMPGDEFSYNQTIGETTADRGYKEANTYVGGNVVPGYGGGVCQISTALYRTAMRANLKSSLRYNHSMMVGYSEASLDATVAEGDIDYRFINTYDFPIYIEGYMTGSTIVFNIYGNVEGMAGKTYELVNEVIDKYDYTTEYVDDPTLAEGQQVTKSGGAAGYKSNGYLVTYENGVEVNRELVSTDIYQPMNAVVLRGTKKATQAPVQEESKNEQQTTEGEQQSQQTSEAQ